MSKPAPPTGPAPSFERAQPDHRTGLTSAQVEARMAAGAHNTPPEGITPSVGRIIAKNVCTLFNLINLVLAVAIILVGELRNALFFGVAICNTALGIFQELRSKRTLDKLSVLSRGKVSAIRDGALVVIEQEQVVLDDILLLATGAQACADGVIVHSDGLEMDESLLTGESDSIRKGAGATILSGSFATAGQAYMRVTAVGEHSYAHTITVQAKTERKRQTPLMRTLNNIIRVLTIAIIPIGILLFWQQYNASGDLDASVLGASAGMLGMIPEGLILLTGVTLTVGALKLAQRKALVQSLYSIETLARVDVLCLDKTGTITDGTLCFEELVPTDNATTPQAAANALCELMAALPDDNATAAALRAAFPGPCAWQCTGGIPFSSARKWSGAVFDGIGTYILGAPEFVFPGGNVPFAEKIREYAAEGYRVLCLAHSQQPPAENTLPPDLVCVALVVLSDTIRETAADTFRFFENEGVTLKVISGDDALTVSTIAARAGITGAEKYIDLSTVGDDANLPFLVERYTVFGRVSPQQKRALILALRENGHTCCMTGDGVNDVLAMKEASCSVSMINGSDAARGACDFVLMTNDFSAMTDVLREGRRVINNIENVASLYLVKTIYSSILSLLYIFIPYPYPFAPLQMTPINSLMVGIPSFFLALRSDYRKPEGRFFTNVLELALPAALTVVLSILIVQLAGIFFGLTQQETSTMNVLLTGTACYFLLWRVARPQSWLEKALLILLGIAFLACFLFFGWFFMLDSLFTRNVFFYAPLMYIGPKLQMSISRLIQRGTSAYARHKASHAQWHQPPAGPVDTPSLPPADTPTPSPPEATPSSAPDAPPA